jgi:hypothetical protein
VQNPNSDGGNGKGAAPAVAAQAKTSDSSPSATDSAKPATAAAAEPAKEESLLNTIKDNAALIGLGVGIALLLIIIVVWVRSGGSSASPATLAASRASGTQDPSRSATLTGGGAAPFNNSNTATSNK